MLLAKAPYRVGQRVTTRNPVRQPKVVPEIPSIVFEPGISWRIASVFVVESNRGVMRRKYRLASHGISVVANESNLVDLEKKADASCDR